jgi:hypothetical protein
MNPDLQKQLTWNAQRNECMRELLAIAEQARHQLAPTIPNGLLLTFYGSMPGCFWRSAAGVSRRTDMGKGPRRETGLGSGDNLTQWLYDSQGNPIAFRGFDTVISRTIPD